MKLPDTHTSPTILAFMHVAIHTHTQEINRRGKNPTLNTDKALKQYLQTKHYILKMH